MVSGGAVVLFSLGFLWFSLVFFGFSSGFLLVFFCFLRLLFSFVFLLFSSGFLIVLNWKDVIGNSTNPDPEWKRGRY